MVFACQIQDIANQINVEGPFYITHTIPGDEKSVFIEREFLTILFHKLRKLKLFYMVNTIPGDEKSALKENF